MEQIVEKITQGILQKTPGQVQSITPDELLASGVPYIVVETVRKNVASSIDSELTLPESEWVQSNQNQVQLAWQDFLEVSKKHLRIPGNKLEHLLNQAVDQCLELAVKPRVSVPELLFRTRETIDLNTVKGRVGAIQVNKQLGLALLRYMEKKEKEEIGIDQARELIKKVDERLVEDYHPLKWAQALKPVFDLAGPEVDTELFRIFFEDKGMPVYARKFEELEEPLNEAEFIEALSSADVLDVDEYEDEQPELFVPVEQEAEPEKVIEIDETPDEEKVITSEENHSEEAAAEENENEFSVDESEMLDDQQEETFSEETENEAAEEPEYESPEASEEESVEDDLVSEGNEEIEEEFEEDDTEEKGQDDNIVNLFSKIREVDHVEKESDSRPVISLVKEEDESEDEEEDNITLLSKFMFDESGEDEDSFEIDGDDSELLDSTPKKEPSSIYEEMNLVQDDGSNRQVQKDSFDEAGDEEDEEEFSFKIESADEEDEPSEEVYPVEKEEINYDVDEDEDDDDQPMWRSFLERDDLETDSGYEYEEESDVEEAEFEKDEEEEFIEEPIYDLTTDEPGPEDKINKISGWMDDEKDRFVDEIFMGSEFAYEQALLDIMDFENWKAASMYLESEVFSRNKVDVYDEVAVDFTDRLHSYFLENNSNHDG